MSKIIVVFGASDQVGRATVEALSGDFNVRAVTEDLCDPGLESLRSRGHRFNVIPVDFSNLSSDLDDALDGCNGCFVATNSNLDSVEGHEKEVREGKAIADACARAGVEHVVYSTQVSVIKTLGVAARHFDAKHVVEEYMQLKGLPLTCIILPVLYEALLRQPFRPTRAASDSYELILPMGSSLLAMMSAEDAGEVVRQLFHQRELYLNKTLSVCGDKLTTGDICGVLNRALSPKIFSDKQMTAQQYGNRRFPGARDLAHMFEFYRRVDQKHSVDLTRQLNPKTKGLEQWVNTNLDEVHQALNDAPLGVHPPVQWSSV